MPEHYSTKQLAIALGLTMRAVQIRAKNESWPSSTRPGRGGGKAFALATLPADIRAKLAEARLSGDGPCEPQGAAEPVEAACPAVPAPMLKDWQREIRDARLIILDQVRHLVWSCGGIMQAERHFADLASQGKLSDYYAGMVNRANARQGTARALSPATLRLWRRTREQQGPDALAPRASASTKPAIPAWLPPLLDRYQTASSPSLRDSYERLVKERPDITLPSLRTVEREIARLGKLAVAPGRMLPRELKQLRAYVKRDFDMLLPADVYTADGHTLDAEVLHPFHGKPFRPEVVSILDVATRRCVGWSVGLAESSWLVADAIRMATEQGICAIFYVDNGCGFKNAFLESPGLGILARMGTTWKHSLPYNSQARGVIERFQRSCWVRAAKRLDAYMGADMDRQARQQVFKASRKDLATLGTTRLLLSWKQFIDWAGDAVDQYNARPHTSLPKILDPATGRKRHMSPDECWAAKAGAAEIVVPSPAECADLFRPYEIRPVRRAVVCLGAKEYFHQALELHHGKEVQVGYDIHDASKVWVRDLDGRLICEAGLDAHAKPYFPLAVVDEAREQRAIGRQRRLEKRLEEVRAELAGSPLAIEAKPATTVIDITPARQERIAELARQAVAEASAPRISTATDTREQRLAWARSVEEALAEGRTVDQADAERLASYQTTPEYRAARKMAEIFGQAAM